MAAGDETLPVQPLHLQRAEQRFAAGVIPTVAATAHRRGDAVVFEQIPEVFTGVLAAAVAMKNQPRLLAGMTFEPRHAQRVDDDIAGHVLAHRPTHDLTAEQVDHHGQEQPALVGSDVGDVTHPDLVRRGHRELAVEQVGGDRQVMVAVGGHLEPFLALRANAVFLHQRLQPMLAHADAIVAELTPDAGSAVAATGLRLDRLDVHQ